LQLTVSRELRDKLQRARDLMMHANPDGDLAIVLERAVDALLDKLQKRILGKAERPRAQTKPTRPGHASQATRREVFGRDGVRCTYVAPDGTRCCATGFLQLDHIEARGRGGGDDEPNLRVLCHAHNQLHAEETFGREHMELRRRKWNVENAELVRRALVHNGFRPRQAEHAVEVVAERHASDTQALGVEAILREALAVLTP
jgi:5-methylcytosine-specific restriction endonuclease McrA